MIGNRLSKLSKGESIFKDAVSIYQAALHTSNFKHNLNYTITPKRKLKRNKIHFNSPFCKSVNTNIGKKVLNLINKHFKINGHLKKLIHWKNCKVSYSCMNSIKAIISKHNKKTMRQNREHDKEKLWNYRTKNSCPLKNTCLQSHYKIREWCETYIGSTDSPLKQNCTVIIVIWKIPTIAVQSFPNTFGIWKTREKSSK